VSHNNSERKLIDIDIDIDIDIANVPNKCHQTKYIINSQVNILVYQ